MSTEVVHVNTPEESYTCMERIKCVYIVCMCLFKTLDLVTESQQYLQCSVCARERSLLKYQEIWQLCLMRLVQNS